MTSTPQFLSQLTQPEALQLLLSPSDLVLLALLAVLLVLGLRRGLVRTVFDLLTGLAALLGASFLAKAAAPYMANYLVLPIVGDVFEKQAASAVQGAVSPEGAGVLERLLDLDAIQSATEPLREAAAQAARAMAESLSYFLLFIILLVALTALLRLLSGALHRVASLGPIGCANSLLGGALGLAGGLVLALLVLFVLSRFAPAMFSPLGVLSPDALDKTLLTRTLYGLLPPI